MASRRKPKSVAWVSPNTHPDVTIGHYREVSEDDPLGGELVVWVDDAPDDPDDPAGHFEFFDGDEAEYSPLPEGEVVALRGVTRGSSGTRVG